MTASPDHTPRLTARERAIASLAFRNLEASIGLLPTKTVRGRWNPRLTRSEVANLRRRLTTGGLL
jgi:hypothetical protein